MVMGGGRAAPRDRLEDELGDALAINERYGEQGNNILREDYIH